MATQKEVNDFLIEFEKNYGLSIPITDEDEFGLNVLEQTNRGSFIGYLDEDVFDMYDQEGEFDEDEDDDVIDGEDEEAVLDRIDAELDRSHVFRVLYLALRDWQGTIKELEMVMFDVMEEMDILEEHPEVITEPLATIVVSQDDLKALADIVRECTGPETHRLYGMLTVRKLQRLAAGRPFPEKFAGLTITSSAFELTEALAELGE
ncbi:hypothetical protein MPK70_gp276 [Erwinia phage pEa_SNUABM_33]|uniref:Uncharacterized protein n=1 Tax=Erwinia phage pEa_SNUABM_33 TaxID=2869556 RepID=A0AAE8C0H8_9CAUD|nr:hypothetical protein MPK70_gp276 [Erwinia phage pEa_SNUABM_33]QZE58152.1 hypothetical protein pEaSNUABM33_00276 [Erwinia phage pEa_SNUABM_33]